MLGWEFPPHISGGLGTACYGLAKGLSEIGVEILFVLPHDVDDLAEAHVRFLTRRVRSKRGGTLLEFHPIPSPLRPYGAIVPPATGKVSPLTPPAADERRSKAVGPIYGGDMIQNTHRYADLVCELAEGESFDLVHAHDWMAFPAGEAVARRSGKPLVAHVHSTEFDRSGPCVHQAVYDIERHGTHAAARVLAVSRLTKGLLTDRYAVSPDRTDVVYNGVLADHRPPRRPPVSMRQDKIVLFLGRVTMQKGPDCFVLAAAELAKVLPEARFMMAGAGDMLFRMIELSAELGIGHKMMFTGFLRGAEVERAYRLADVYVMPSVSEPFGITALEAMLRGVPVVISRQSGVAEVVRHALRVDCWDAAEIADKIAAVLRDRVLFRELSVAGAREARRLDWSAPARRCLESYEKALAA
jgi:glycosyltransferase involved in cell wall biosynthesis